jgi:hypothetical protein
MKLLQHLARQVIRAQVHGATPGRLVDSVAIPVIEVFPLGVSRRG